MDNFKIRHHGLLVLFILYLSCSEPAQKEQLIWQTLSNLPEPVANNAVASVQMNDTTYLYSFMGLSEGKTYKDVHSKAFKYNMALDEWTQISDVPGGSGRLAGTAVTAHESIYIFGGYTVAEDGSEISVPEVLRLDPATDSYTLVTQMPVPVDDAVSVVYKDRYIYLISGWHNDNNVENVQLFDTKTGEWKQATPFPGPPVFGHAGGISGNTIIIADGVKIVPQGEGSRTFEMSPGSWMGTIHPDLPEEINWIKLPQHPGPARYRMAATGTSDKIVFAGGSSNPYNYNGIGYNGDPSRPGSTLFAFSIQDSSWKKTGTAAEPTMDHRSLLKVNDWYYLVGGMLENQQVSDKVFRFKLNDY